MANTNEAYVAAHFGIELDNTKDVALFRSIEGGSVKADVMTYQYGANKEAGYGRFRQLGKPKVEDIKLQVGMAMSQPFYNWLKDFFDGKGTRKDGAIVAADFYYKERARRTFTNAMIKELTFPKLDAKDKNAAYMNVALAVEDIATAPGKGEALQVPSNMKSPLLWTACNFELRLDDYADACSRCTKIDAFTIKQNIIEYHAGGFKAAIKTPSSIDFPNIVFYVPEPDAQPFMDHMARRVGYGGKGNGEVRPPTAMHGQIDCYDSTFTGLLFSLEFFGADIVSVTPDKSDSSTEEVKQMKVEVYTEKMSFWYPNMELE